MKDGDNVTLVYLVVGTFSDAADSSSWNIRAFIDRKEADDLAAELNEKNAKYTEEFTKWAHSDISPKPQRLEIFGRTTDCGLGVGFEVEELEIKL